MKSLYLHARSASTRRAGKSFLVRPAERSRRATTYDPTRRPPSRGDARVVSQYEFRRLPFRSGLAGCVTVATEDPRGPSQSPARGPFGGSVFKAALTISSTLSCSAASDRVARQFRQDIVDTLLH